MGNDHKQNNHLRTSSSQTFTFYFNCFRLLTVARQPLTSFAVWTLFTYLGCNRRFRIYPSWCLNGSSFLKRSWSWWVCWAIKIRENAEGRRLDDKSFHSRYRSLHKSSHVEWGCNYKKGDFPGQEAGLFRGVLTSKYLTLNQLIVGTSQRRVQSRPVP
jgi:hypothetical protein